MTPTRTPLAELAPCFVGHGGHDIFGPQGEEVPRREGIGIAFNCPCGCRTRIFLAFLNPLDGGKPISPGGQCWTRHGESIDNISLHPSILQIYPPDGCGWHGWLIEGMLTGAVETRQ